MPHQWWGPPGFSSSVGAGTDKSWAQAGGNGLYDSVETEGHPTEMLTGAQITALAKLVRWEHETYGTPYTVINTPGAGRLEDDSRRARGTDTEE